MDLVTHFCTKFAFINQNIMALILKLNDPKRLESSKKFWEYGLKQQTKTLNFKKWPVIIPSFLSSSGTLILDGNICQHQIIC